LHSFHMTLNQVPLEHLETIVATAQLDSVNHLYEEIGLGNRTALLAAKQLAKLAEVLEKPLTSDMPTVQPLAIKGTEGIAVTYARCCRPIPGDPIGGYIEPGHGLVVHVEHCPALGKYHNNPEKFVTLHWERNVTGDFPVDLSIDIINQRGTLASLAIAVSEADSNIANINAEEFGERDFTINLTITVHDRIHLARVLRKIRKNKNVIKVLRKKPPSVRKRRLERF
jgi:GTP diphosphokinase / guanosine-3',5'-bis(diphosphate) 3'-diphosphatase